MHSDRRNFVLLGWKTRITILISKDEITKFINYEFGSKIEFILCFISSQPVKLFSATWQPLSGFVKWTRNEWYSLEMQMSVHWIELLFFFYL